MDKPKYMVWDSQRKLMYGCQSIHWENDGKMTFKKGSGITMDEKLGDALLESTGIPDQVNRCIYQDDLLMVVGDLHKVIWHFNRWVMKDVKTGRIHEFRKTDQNFRKIVGNAHSHPELLNNQPQ